MRSMQQDAIRRVMEMQRRANERLHRSGGANSGGNRPAQGTQSRSNSGRGGQHSGQGTQHPQQAPQRPNSGGQAHSPQNQHPVQHPPAPQGQSGGLELPFTSGALEGIISRLGLESDQLILVGLLLLLINEGADTTLIMAVFYMLI
jgi:hypothetical protein